MRVTTRTVEHKTYHCSFCDYQEEDEQDVRDHEAGVHHIKEYRLLGREGHGQEEFFRFESEASFWEYVGGKGLFAYDWAWQGPGWYGLMDGQGQLPELVAAQEVLNNLRAELAAQQELVAAVEALLAGPPVKTEEGP